MRRITGTAAGRPAIALLTLVGVFSVWMRAGFPVFGIGNAYDDDRLFLTLARYISQGRWLGPFDDLTLVKGPVYPMFIAAAGMLHVPLKVAEQVCTVAAAAALFRWIASREIMGRRPAAYPALGSVIFTLLCLDPIVWTSSLARVIREGIYGSLSLAVVTLTLATCFPSRPSRLGGALLLGAGLGLVGSAFWLTREEGVWLVPSVVVVMGVAAMAEWPKWRAARSRGTVRALCGPPAWRPLASFGSAALTCAIVAGSIATMNLRYYGAFEVTEAKSSAFTHAYGALSRIEPDQWQRYIVFPKDARERAYAVSPAARELAPVLESEAGQRFAALHCNEFAIAPCTGFHAGWFQWILRSAATAAGHYGSAAESRAFYERLAREIDQACDAHALRCLAARNTLAPPFRWTYLADALHEAWPMVRLLVTLGETQIVRLPSDAAGGDLDAIADMVGPVQPGAAKAMVLHGWVATPSRTPGMAVISRQEGGRFTGSVDLVPQGESDARFPGLHDVEFTINTDCPRQDCDIVLSVPGQTDIRLPVSGLAKNTMPVDGLDKMRVDSVDEIQAFPFHTMMEDVQLGLARHIAVAYGAVRILWPIALASLALAFALDIRRPKPLPLYALALASLAAVVSRVGLLSYLQVTSIPSRNLLYLSPAMPFLITFIVTALFLGGQSVARVVSAGKPLPRAGQHDTALAR